MENMLEMKKKVGRKPHVTKEQAAAMLELSYKGYSMASIAKHYGLNNHCYVSRAIAKLKAGWAD